jgi:DNA polymerase/3'-5' exonuclease PolX
MKKYNIEKDFLELIEKAISKAEEKQIYKNCVCPNIGKNILKCISELKKGSD